MHSIELTIDELEAETAAALPARHLMSVFSSYNWTGIYAGQEVLAVNAATLASSATALGGQSITVTQF